MASIGSDHSAQDVVMNDSSSNANHKYNKNNNNHNNNRHNKHNGNSGLKCDYYNRTKCVNTGKGCGESKEICRPPDGSQTLCYALWHNNSVEIDGNVVSNVTMEYKGCWVGNIKDCNHNSQCVGSTREAKKRLFFCCCDGDLCNTNITQLSPITHSPPQNASITLPSLSSPISPSDAPSVAFITLLTIVPLIIVFCLVLSACVFWLYCVRKRERFTELATAEPVINYYPPPTPYTSLRPIQLMEVKAQGKFGSVWKARSGAELVAVKIFSLQERYSWQVEQEVYCLPQMKHPNLLTFLGAEKRGEGLGVEFWLITEYHALGSLWDYLKANTVTWNQLLIIAQGIARGLTHLHEEMPSTHSNCFKPSIAHRDFKSKNVLLKSNLTACVADFGLALVFYPNSTRSNGRVGQAGTRRYMAPEVLEGAINFSRDSFLRIDMYACGLVLWELMSRCYIPEMGPSGDYQLPFEDEVGQHPTLEDMQETVAQHKKRPPLKESWLKHLGMNALCHTVEECWDHDAEARLSASCVGERIDVLSDNFYIYV